MIQLHTLLILRWGMDTDALPGSGWPWRARHKCIKLMCSSRERQEWWLQKHNTKGHTDMAVQLLEECAAKGNIFYPKQVTGNARWFHHCLWKQQSMAWPHIKSQNTMARKMPLETVQCDTGAWLFFYPVWSDSPETALYLLQQMPDEDTPSCNMSVNFSPSFYSPDLALSHYYLLMTMKDHMRGWHYENDMAVHSRLFSSGRNVWHNRDFVKKVTHYLQ
jgi:hypothetical protein